MVPLFQYSQWYKAPPRMSLWNVLTSIYLTGNARLFVDSCIAHAGGAEAMASIGILEYFLKTHLPLILRQSALFDSSQLLPGNRASTGEETPEPRQSTSFYDIIEALHSFVQKRSSGTAAATASTASASSPRGSVPHMNMTNQRLANTMNDTNIWLEFCDMYLGSTKAVLDINVRAAAWRLLLDVVAGPCQTWNYRYARVIIPYVDLYKRAAEIEPRAQVSASECGTADADISRSWLKGNIHRALLRGVIYTYIRQHRSIGYVQSMSFVAAVFVYVFTLHTDPAEVPTRMLRGSDTAAAAQPISAGTVNSAKGILSIYDIHARTKNYGLYDMYTCFCRVVMQLQDLWVGVNPQTGCILADLTNLRRTSREIFQLVSVYDVELYSHLQAESPDGVEPTIYFQKPIETMFSDGLPLDDVLQLWDYLFAGFVDRVSFLVRLKHACAAFMIIHREHFFQSSPERPSYFVIDHLFKHPWKDTCTAYTLVEKTIELTRRFYATDDLCQ